MERDGGGGNHPSEEPRSYPPVALSFPLTRVKKIIKADKQVGVIQADAVLTMAAVAVRDTFEFGLLGLLIGSFLRILDRPSINYK